MPNLTISVPDELKNEMDKLTEVNWSEVSRNAISAYIEQRKNPTPILDVVVRDARLDPYAYDTGNPSLKVDLWITNKMSSEIIIDRVLSTAFFIMADRHYPIGTAYDFVIRYLPATASGMAQLYYEFSNELISILANKTKSTFKCKINCNVFVKDFKNNYSREVTTNIPIDHWLDFVEKAVHQKDTW
jgi:hypothetical protein